ncbi:E3 ubiquitin-protein ligase TRIM7-like [Salarias fasciatus]|uniref:E3 ubiquitin-protein ligase TRIM7-like n=1 Tax=Salarias fasciatus TaxID=181472 RepID=A0A672HW51_SALFA|nr:E3 ubiquitin-protein ligase TRIM7-like [Salarias fasciatus]
MEVQDATWLEEKLKCPVCHDVLADPRQLPCGHSMCMSCVEKLLDHASSSSEAPLRCPDCRADWGPVVALQRSYTLSSIAEDFRQNKRITENQRRSVFCDLCPDGRTSASRTCLKCELSLCTEHVRDHQQLPALAGHPLVSPLGDLTDRRCRQHGDEVLRYYCSSSRRYICNICALEVKQLNVAAEASAVLRRQLTEYMDQHFETLQGQITDFTESVRKLQDEVQHEKLRMNPGHPHLNGVTVVLLFLWFIVLYYAYNFSVENQMLTEALKKQQNHRSHMYSPSEEHLLNQLHKPPEKEHQGTPTSDLDTTGCSLGASADLQTQNVKPGLENPPRKLCTDDAPPLSCSQCFSSGTHVWEVEAEGRWDIFVFYKSQDSGAESWSLGHDGEGSLFARHNKTTTPLAAMLASSRIAVAVDFQEGRIAFSAVGFTATQLHEFKAELTQPVCLKVEVSPGDARSRASVVKAA